MSGGERGGPGARGVGVDQAGAVVELEDVSGRFDARRDGAGGEAAEVDQGGEAVAGFELELPADADRLGVGYCEFDRHLTVGRIGRQDLEQRLGPGGAGRGRPGREADDAGVSGRDEDGHGLRLRAGVDDRREGPDSVGEHVDPPGGGDRRLRVGCVRERFQRAGEERQDLGGSQRSRIRVHGEAAAGFGLGNDPARLGRGQFDPAGASIRQPRLHRRRRVEGQGDRIAAAGLQPGRPACRNRQETGDCRGQE